MRDSLGKQHPRSFTITRAVCLAFVRSTLKKSHPLWLAISAVEPRRVPKAAPRPDLTPEWMRQMFPNPQTCRMSDDYEYPYRYTRTVLAGVLVKRADPAKENQLTVRVNTRGHVVSAASTREPGDFMAAMRATRDRYPLEHTAIVMPDGWTLNEDGSATQVRVQVQDNKQAA